MMYPRDKAAVILAALVRVSRSAIQLTTDDILAKVKSEQELDFYYRWCK